LTGGIVVNLAGRYDIICDQGSTLERTFVYRDASKNPINNSGWSARMQVRASFKSDAAVLDLSTDNGGIVLGGANGEIYVVASASAMAQLKAGNMVYDIELITPTTVMKPVRGNFTVRPEVTQ
jgi:hypothetical protein